MEPTSKTTYILEMAAPGDLRPKTVDLPGLRVERMATPLPEYNKFLHTVVGQAYRWGGRQAWTQEDWTAYVGRASVETWVATLDGTPAGYFEIEQEPDGAVHLHNLGLLPPFIGRGLGAHLLTLAVERAWAWGATRVWLSTCSHDHPHALHNYLARGFRIAETRVGPANPPLRSFWARMTGAEGAGN